MNQSFDDRSICHLACIINGVGLVLSQPGSPVFTVSRVSGVRYCYGVH